MKKGEIYEGVIEKIDFQNKGRVKIKDTTVTGICFCGGSEGSDQERNSGTEGTLYDSEETFRKGTGTYPGGNRKITIGDKRTGMQQFSGMWWLHVSDNVL